jgi:hypothetical protein
LSWTVVREECPDPFDLAVHVQQILNPLDAKHAYGALQAGESTDGDPSQIDGGWSLTAAMVIWLKIYAAVVGVPLI